MSNKQLDNKALESGSEPYLLSIQYDKDCFLEAYNQRLRMRWPLLGLRYVLVLLCAFAAYWFWHKELLAIYFVAAGCLLAIQPVMQRWWWLRNTMKGVVPGAPVNFEFTAEDISVTAANSEARIGWEGLHKISISERGYFLWLQHKIYYYLPKALILEQGLHQLLQEKQRESLKK